MRSHYSDDYIGLYMTWSIDNRKQISCVRKAFYLIAFNNKYRYDELLSVTIVKEYNNVEGILFSRLVKDNYNRLWLHTFYKNSNNGEMEEIFDFVESVEQADSYSSNIGLNYNGHLCYFIYNGCNFLFVEKVSTFDDIEEYAEKILNANNISRHSSWGRYPC